MSIRTGADVRDIREGRGLTQESLAIMACISVRSLRRAESGHAVSPETLRCLAAALDVPFEFVRDEAVASVPFMEREASAIFCAQAVFLCIFQATMLSMPACVTAYPEFYAEAARVAPGLDNLIIVAQVFGIPALFAWGVYVDVRRKGTRLSNGGCLRMQMIAVWCGIPVQVAWGNLGMHPIGVLMYLGIAYGTVKSFPSLDRVYQRLLSRLFHAPSRSPAS